MNSMMHLYFFISEFTVGDVSARKIYRIMPSVIARSSGI